MGRLKSDDFGVKYLSSSTIEAIRRDISLYAKIEPNDYEFGELIIRVPRSGKLQRRRIKDTIRRLYDFLNGSDAEKYGVKVPIYTPKEYGGIKIAASVNHIVSCAEFANITGRNIKTVYSWVNNKLLAIERRSCCTAINVEKTIEELKKLEKKLS